MKWLPLILEIDRQLGCRMSMEPRLDSCDGTANATVAIVFYDGLEDLNECLGCLARQTLKPRRILVVDNSEAGLPSDLCELGTGVEILRASRNLGFAGGNNLALRQTGTEFFATLNADAFPEPEWLESLVEAARSHPEAAAFGGLQIQHENPTLADGIGDQYHFSGLAWRRGYLCELASLDLTPRRIFSPCGAAAFFRTADLLAIGGFDEDFFCYCEDLDVGFRLWLAGRECRFVPKAVVRHRGAGSTGDSHSDFAVYHGHRNLVWVYLKNMPGIFFWIFLPLHLLMNLQMAHAVTLRGQGEVVRGSKRDALLSIARVWDKRLAIQSQRKASLGAIWRVLDKSIPPEPWRRTFQRLKEQIRRRLAGEDSHANKL
jgi:GT2 family glycosyltransferase